jgi:predicted nucleic acid-binding protein
MILLDTNVVSEAMKPLPNSQVLGWLNAQAAETLFVSFITFAELLFGVAAMPQGQRKLRLEETVDGLADMYKGRILGFDLDTAKIYARLAALAKSKGQGFPTADGYIAAIAASKRMIVATRDTAPFAAVGLEVINPWLA